MNVGLFADQSQSESKSALLEKFAAQTWNWNFKHLQIRDINHRYKIFRGFELQHAATMSGVFLVQRKYVSMVVLVGASRHFQFNFQLAFVKSSLIPRFEEAAGVFMASPWLEPSALQHSPASCKESRAVPGQDRTGSVLTLELLLITRL